tara:strand:+ start:290 stop:508 length:219 start_codon:yes stop_codon:yes gene_type:complete
MKYRKNSSTSKVLKHLMEGNTLSQLEAMPPSKFNTIRLGAIIKVLRDRGHDIITETVRLENGKSYGRYRMDI